LEFRLFGEPLNLREADLSKQNFRGIDFNHGDLRRVKFISADLTKAHFTGAEPHNEKMLSTIALN
jgi:uncharacterized protein YjbI with pentapeptide repeats